MGIVDIDLNVLLLVLSIELTKNMGIELTY